jgi:cytochrome c-type biogenesis protein CcmH
MRPDPRRSAGGAALLLALLFPALQAVAADLTPQQQIESRLMCYCGCSDLTVRTCTCGTAEGIRGEIAERLGKGETADQVLAAFVAQYGEKILSAPTTRGFNLVAWVAPFAVILAAAAALVVVVRRWGRAAGAPETAPARAAPPSAAERALLERIEREIREER